VNAAAQDRRFLPGCSRQSPDPASGALAPTRSEPQKSRGGTSDYHGPQNMSSAATAAAIYRVSVA
jgi:hypothetical protein